MPVPKISHIQFLVLDVLATKGDVSATTLREALRESGEDRDGPKFYQLMQRLARSGLVRTWPQRFDVGGGEVRRTFYQITPQGQIAWKQTLNFYAVRLAYLAHPENAS